MRAACAAMLLSAAIGCAPLHGQQIEPTVPTLVADSIALAPLSVSPRGAFLRALAVPGWGHAAIGSYTRAGFYVAVESATLYALMRSRYRLGEVNDRVAFREQWVRDQQVAMGETDPQVIEEAVDADSEVELLRTLQETRRDQREDMVAFGIFVLFLSGADAYVSAHLSRFPDPLEINAQPLGNGRYEVSARIRLPN